MNDVTISRDLANRLDWSLRHFSRILTQVNDLAETMPQFDNKTHQLIELNGYLAAISIKLCEAVHHGDPEPLEALGLDQHSLNMSDKVIEIFTRRHPDTLHDSFALDPTSTPGDSHDDPTDSTFFEFKLTRNDDPQPNGPRPDPHGDPQAG